MFLLVFAVLFESNELHARFNCYAARVDGATGCEVREQPARALHDVPGVGWHVLLGSSRLAENKNASAPRHRDTLQTMRAFSRGALWICAVACCTLVCASAVITLQDEADLDEALKNHHLLFVNFCAVRVSS